MKLCPTCNQCYEDVARACSQEWHDPLVLKRAGPRLINSKYRLDSLLGHGGMGAVYRCTHVELNHTMAIKLLLTDYSEADPNGRQRLRREALTTCRLNHPNLVRVHDCGTNVVVVEDEDGSHSYDELYVVMELLDGQTLRDYLRQVGRLSLQQAVRIALQVASGLAEIHSKGIVHRDLKPANTMLTRDHTGDLLVKIVDFGAVKFIKRDSAPDDADLTGALMLGSPRYTSPENCRGEPLDERSDIYCLGLILYEMVAGRHPFSSTERADLIYQHAYLSPPSLDEVCDGIPAPLVRLVMSSLSKQPGERPQSAASFTRALFELKASCVEVQTDGDEQIHQASLANEDQEGRCDADEEPLMAGTLNAAPSWTTGGLRLDSHFGDALGAVAAPDEQTILAGAVTAAAAAQREAKHVALGLVYFAAFLAAMTFLTWSFLSRRPVTGEAVGSVVGRADSSEPAREVGTESIATTDINIRSEPSLKAEKIGMAEKGSRVRVISKSGNWREVIVLEQGRVNEDGETTNQGWLDGALLQPPED